MLWSGLWSGNIVEFQQYAPSELPWKRISEVTIPKIAQDFYERFLDR